MTTEIQSIELWTLIAALLVLSMQAGFLLLEAGTVRSKNAVSVAQKNISDFSISSVAFLLVGFYIAFGIHSPFWKSVNPQAAVDFLFQLGFCSATITIVSGAVAERMRFTAYLALAVIVSCLLYPLAVSVTWGSSFLPDRPSFLGDLGFVDFAGGTVIHALAAGIALAAILHLGPRRGRFNKAGEVIPFVPHQPIFSMMGAIILFFGWLGFNAGGVAANDPMFMGVILATLIAAAFGSMAGMFTGRQIDAGVFKPTRMVNGLIGGLVWVTP